MEKIIYNKTLDTHKHGVQFTLQGFETADKMSRRIVLSLMASGDAIDLPLEQIEAVMYITTPNVEEVSLNFCTIKDNTIIYDVLPITEEGTTIMQLKLVETRPDGARSVLASPSFAVEVLKSAAEDESVQQTATFTALEDAIAKAKSVYDGRFLRMELTSDCVFKAYYADGTYYETDVLKKLFLNGNVELSKSYAMGGTGVRAGEDTDNSKYYYNVAKSEALNAQNIMENSEELLEEVRLQGVYTAFSVDFETGEVEYVSPSFTFQINKETGELDAIGQTYTFNDEVGRVVEEWLAERGIELDALQEISTTHETYINMLKSLTTSHASKIALLNESTNTNAENINNINEDVVKLYKGVEEAKVYKVPWDTEKNVKSLCLKKDELSLEADTTVFNIIVHDEVSFQMINSGNIIMPIHTYIENYPEYAELNVLHNGENIYHLKGEERTKIQELFKGKDHVLDLTVNEDDVFYIEVKCKTNGDGLYASVGANVDIQANYSTPYKYWDIKDFLIEE